LRKTLFRGEDVYGTKHLFPIFLDLQGRECLVVGGGDVALRKVKSLLQCGARVKVVAPEMASGVQTLAGEPGLTMIRKGFEETDLDGVFMVFCATDQDEVNASIARLCERRGILVNVVDKPEECTFIVPSVLRRGPLSIAVSTGGNSPLWARRVRELLESVITDEYGEFTEMLGAARDLVKKTYPDDIARRQQVFQSLVDSDIFQLLRSGQKEKAKERMEQCIFSLPG